MNSSAWLTWRQLKDALECVPEDRLDDPVQVWPHDPCADTPELSGAISFEFLSVLCSGSESGEQVVTTRGVLDGQHHPEHLVLLVDGCPFDEHGNTSFELVKGPNGEPLLRGDKDGLLRDVEDNIVEES